MVCSNYACADVACCDICVYSNLALFIRGIVTQQRQLRPFVRVTTGAYSTWEAHLHAIKCQSGCEDCKGESVQYVVVTL